jgi:hypothetical protein
VAQKPGGRGAEAGEQREGVGGVAEGGRQREEGGEREGTGSKSSTCVM